MRQVGKKIERRDEIIKEPRGKGTGERGISIRIRK